MKTLQKLVNIFSLIYFKANSLPYSFLTLNTSPKVPEPSLLLSIN